MDKIGQSKFLWLEFDEKGSPDAGNVDVLKSAIAAPDIADIVVMSHGWKNTKDDAWKLYSELWTNTDPGAERKQKTLIVGVVWPAKKFPTDFDQQSVQGKIAQTAGQQAGTRDLTAAELETVFSDFELLFGDRASEVVKISRDVAENAINVNNAVALMKAANDLLGIPGGAFDNELSPGAKSIDKASHDADRAQSILVSMAPPPSFKKTKSGGTQGLGDAITSVFQGTGAAVARFLNQLTYFEMKKRSGVVGVSLTKSVLSKLAPGHNIRLHLVGHSFGGRLVTAAANDWHDTDLKLTSVTLLQAAYSHNGLAETVDGIPGAFHNVIGKISGPFAITHTHNDSACTIAYPLASRLARDVASALGGAEDKYGAMGANGPQLLAKSLVDSHATIPAQLTPGKINSILADSFITEHNDVSNAKCGKMFSLVFK